MIVIYLSILVMILGLLMYVFARPEQPKASEIGRLMFFAGLLAFLLSSPAILGLIGVVRR